MKILMTTAGLGALVLWAMAPLLLCELDAIPTFQLSGLVLMIAFLFVSAKLTIQQQWKRVRQPVSVWMAGFLIILINQAAYVYSMKLVSPAEAEVVYYLWPILLVIVSNLFLAEKRSWMPVAASTFGFSGIYLLMSSDADVAFSYEVCIGYSAAFAAALAWVFYSLYTRHHRALPLEMNGMWCGLAALGCFALHGLFESPAPAISLYQWGLLTFIGVGILSLSLFLWATGMRHGHLNVLSVMAYMTPIISVSMLVLCGRAPFTEVLFFSAQLVILGGLLCTFVEHWRSQREEAL